MKYHAPDRAETYTKAYRKKKIWKRVMIILVAVVVFCTTYALTLPAITLEKQDRVLDCPVSVHQHTENCYSEVGNLVCGQADFMVHVHNEKCKDKNENLICRLPEIAAHQHTAACYRTEAVLVCDNLAVLHKHSESCYDNDANLICGQLAVLEHSHEEGCFVQSESSNVESQPEDISSGEKLLVAPYGAVISAWAQIEKQGAKQSADVPQRAEANGTPQESDPIDLTSFLTTAKIQVNGIDYDGSPLDRNGNFTVVLESEIEENDLHYQYKLPEQIVVQNTGSAEQPLALMAGNTQIGSYYIQDNTVYINYAQSNTKVTTKLELSATWNKAVQDEETLVWGPNKTAEVTFINKDIAVEKSDSNNGVMQVAENGDLYAEYTIRAMLDEGGQLKISDTMSDGGQNITTLWKGCYNDGTADYELTIHTYSGEPKNPDKGQVGETQYGKFSDSAETTFSIEDISLEKNQYVEIKYKVKVDADDRFKLDGNQTKLTVENTAKAEEKRTDDKEISSSVTHNVTYQTSAPWVQKTADNTSSDSNADHKWKVTINAQQNVDMEGAVVMDNIFSDGTTYNTAENTFTVTITGKDGSSDTKSLQVIDMETIEPILKANGFTVDNFEDFIAYTLGGSQSVDEMNQQIKNFESIFQQLLGINEPVDVAVLSRYVFVDNRDEVKDLSKNTYPLFLWVVPPNSAVSDTDSGPYSYELNYSTHSEEGTTAVVNQAKANWRGISGGTGPITTFEQKVAIDKHNAGVYTGTDGNMYVDWTIDVEVPPNSAAIPNVWLVDQLPSTQVKFSNASYETFPALKGMSDTLDAESLENYNTEFGNEVHQWDSNNQTLQYLHGLVEDVFTITGSGGEEAIVDRIVQNAHPVLGVTGFQLNQNFALYSGLAERLGTMRLEGNEQYGSVSPKDFSIWLGDLPATEEGYKITINYTTQVNPYTMPLAAQDYVTGTNTVSLYSDLNTGTYIELADAKSQYWLAKQSAEDSIVKNIEHYDPKTGILTYRVQLDPLDNLYVGSYAYQIHDSLSSCPGAAYIEGSFKLYVHANFIGETSQNAVWSYDPAVKRLIWASDSDVFKDYDAGSFEKQIYNYLTEEVKTDGLATPITRVVQQISNTETGSSNFYLTLNNTGWLGTEDGHFVPLTLEYQVQLPKDDNRYIDNEVLFSAYDVKTPSNIYLIGASYASFDTQNIIHKSLYQMPSLQNNYMAGFQININRTESEELMHAKEIVVHDVLSDTLQLVVSSIKLEGKNQADANWTEISSDGWSLKRDGSAFDVTIYTDEENGNTVYEQYRLTYQTKVLGEQETTVHYSNQASIQSLGINSEKIENNVFIQKVGGSADVTNLKITLLKVDGNDLTKRLDDVRFELYTYTADGQWEEQTTSEALVTDENGKIQLVNGANGVSLHNNTWYALKESHYKTGYLSTEPVYFYIPKEGTTETPTNPSIGINDGAFTSGQRISSEGELIIENYTPYFILEKRDARTNALVYDAGFTLYSDRECTEVVKKLESTSGIFTFDRLEAGKTYYLKETTIPKGYLNPDAIYEVTVAPNGSVTIEKLDASGSPITDGSSEITKKDGEGVVFVANNTPASYELPDTGGPGIWLYTLGGGILMVGALLIVVYRCGRTTRQ